MNWKSYLVGQIGICLESMKDEDIDFSDIEELNPDSWTKVDFKKPVTKSPVTVRLDQDILRWLKSGGGGYQTRINAILRSYMEAHRD